MDILCIALFFSHKYLDPAPIAKSLLAAGEILPLQAVGSNQIFYYARCITPKRVTNLRNSSTRHCNCGQHISFRRNAAAMANHWQHCV